MKSRAVQITRVFLYLLAAIWLAVGVNYLGQSDGSTIFQIIAAMMFASVIIFIALGMYITKRLVYWLGMIILAASILLTIFDQFGFADLVAVVLFAIPLALMLAKRNEFLQETQ